MDRRRFLAAGALAAGLAPVAAACSAGTGGKGGGGGSVGPTAPKGGADADLDAAGVAAGMEKILVDTYTVAGQLATTGGLGALIPPAVADLVATGISHHQEHMDAWNTMRTSAGRQAVTTPHPALKPVVDAAAARLVDIPGTVALALRLEDYASRTYLKMIAVLGSPDAIHLAARILVVDQEHQALLRYLLGLNPVGSGLARDTRDFAPADPGLNLVTGPP